MSADAQGATAAFVAQLAQDLNDKRLELPAFPDSVIRIRQAVQDENKDIDDIVDILSSDPALAARLLQIANSAAMRTGGGEISDVRSAILRLGLNLVSSVAASFAMRQLQRNENYSADARQRLEKIWHRSLNVAANCRVIANNFTKINADEALLTGLLHVLGRLYVFMRAQDAEGLGAEELDSISNDWHTAIAKAITETWGLSEQLATAMEQQEDYDVKFRGPVTLSEILICAKVLNQTQGQAQQTPLTAAQCPSFERLGIVSGPEEPVVFDQYEDEVSQIRNALAG